MVSIRDVAADIGIDTSGEVSILGHFFGFYRKRPPVRSDSTIKVEVSLLDQVNALKGDYINFNVIKVGVDEFEEDEIDKIDFAVFRTRQIFTDEGIGVGRVEHYEILSSESNGLHEITSEQDATDLTQDWSVFNDGLDVFFVHSITAKFVGISNIDGPCYKNADERNGSITDKVRTSDKTARTCAHEIGHYLGLEHRNSWPENLMAQTASASSPRDSVKLTDSQVDTANDHCSLLHA